MTHRLTAPNARLLRVRLLQLKIKYLLEELDEEGCPRRREWVNVILRKRHTLGEFQNLVQELRLEPERHVQYFRLTPEGFDLLLARIQHRITPEETPFRTPISAPQRLALTLRYLASGMEFSALAPTYRVGESTCRKLVYDTCRAIVDELGPVYMPAPTEEIWEASEKKFNER